jgi:hypothetical protein
MAHSDSCNGLLGTRYEQGHQPFSDTLFRANMVVGLICSVPILCLYLLTAVDSPHRSALKRALQVVCAVAVVFSIGLDLLW